MKKLTLLVMLFISSLIYSQRKNITGYVYDAKNSKALTNALVFVEGDDFGTETDKNGKFVIKTRKDKKLIISYLGYAPKSVIVKDDLIIKIYLEEKINHLSNVLIKSKKNINDIDLRKVTSAITTFNPEKIKNRASVNVIASLQGQIPGLSIKTSGELGKALKIRIRGNSTLSIKSKKKLSKEAAEIVDNKFNQPLFVLDGQIISAEACQLLNVNDIETIKVLKDATANALYGVKAANGVIEFTSKRGKNGKTEYSFSLQQGITFRGEPSQTMMDTKEKLEFERMSKNEDTPGYFYTEDYIRKSNVGNPNLKDLISKGKIKLDSLGKINTNWFNELAKINIYKSYNISSRGGSLKNKFYISSNFTKQGGKFEGNDIKRFTGRLNYEYELSKKVYVMLNSSFSFSNNNTPNSSNYSPSDLMYVLNPYEQKNKGVLVSYPKRTFKDLVNQFSKNREDSNFNFSGNINSEIIKNLHLSSILGIQYQVGESISIVPPTAYTEKRDAVLEERGKATKNKSVTSNITANTRLNYNIDYNDHSFSFSTNMDYYKNSYNYIGIVGYGLPSKLLSGAGINNSIIGSRKSQTSSKNTTDATLGIGFSSLYSWNSLLNLYGSYKLDASSLLPKEKRWNTFYALGAALTFNSKNSFLEDIENFESLKFKGSYGKTASLAGIEPSLAVPTFSYDENIYLGLRGFSLKNLFNESLVPEKSTSINIGLEASLFNDLKLGVNVYHRRTTDMLLTVPIAPSNGFSYQLRNVGIMDNQGLEIYISKNIIKTKTFSWHTSINCAYNENKVIDLYDGTTLSLSGNPYPDYEEGKSSSILYGLRSLGVNPADGKPYFIRKDGTRFNGDKEKPNKEDFVVLGMTTPPFNGGCYHNFRYKKLQLSFDFYYSFGSTVKLTNLSRVSSVSDAEKNLTKNKLKQTWFNIGDENKIYPSIFTHGEHFWENIAYANTDNIGSNDFIRLNNIMLKYSYSNDYIKSISNGFASNLSFYLQLKNVGYWSNFKGGDPETANLKGSTQPILTFGLNVGF